MPDNITFRAHLFGNITDFAEKCQMGDLLKPSILVEIIVALARYQEEGTRLTPQLYLCESMRKLVSLLPNHGELHVGVTSLSEDSIGGILKKCAPLATDGWCIFIEANGDQINYGLFSDSQNPLAIPIDEVLLSSDQNEVKVVRVYQTAEDCVEIKSYCGGFHNIFMSHKREDTPSPTQYISDLTSAICEKVPDEVKETVTTFMLKALREALGASHGSLIAVITQDTIPKLLEDGVPLSTPIDFADHVLQVANGAMQQNVVISDAALLKGMLSCDGIVLFTRDSKLIAYNCFVTGPTTPGRPTTGGARQRAFDTLCSKLGRGVYAAFMQSQDGWTNFRKHEND